MEEVARISTRVARCKEYKNGVGARACEHREVSKETELRGKRRRRRRRRRPVWPPYICTFSPTAPCRVVHNKVEFKGKKTPREKLEKKENLN